MKNVDDGDSSIIISDRDYERFQVSTKKKEAVTNFLKSTTINMGISSYSTNSPQLINQTDDLCWKFGFCLDFVCSNPLQTIMATRKKVAVIGAGVVGLSVALRLLEEHNDEVHVTIIADKFLHQTTTYSCGGLWEPYQIAGVFSKIVKLL